eukprot:CAMPEP_0198670800 /NCGR_PEP_ID=MMETSP1467-20131203/82904_1 /TAXON_ID=1462469 /ORGANISM="unid. sp., Strain CCMP2135" /LENGTH=46 /DNA_ID= /DNA_START= /DNA_END= /DNA_ORIENTATION=
MSADTVQENAVPRYLSASSDLATTVLRHLSSVFNVMSSRVSAWCST